jgi:hypothetical protein
VTLGHECPTTRRSIEATALDPSRLATRPQRRGDPAGLRVRGDPVLAGSHDDSGGLVNPRRLALMVTLIAGMQFAGYVAGRVLGSAQGAVRRRCSPPPRRSSSWSWCSSPVPRLSPR